MIRTFFNTGVKLFGFKSPFTNTYKMNVCLQKQYHISPVIKHLHIIDISNAYIDVSPGRFSVTLDTKQIT